MKDVNKHNGTNQAEGLKNAFQDAQPAPIRKIIRGLQEVWNIIEVNFYTFAAEKIDAAKLEHGDLGAIIVYYQVCGQDADGQGEYQGE